MNKQNGNRPIDTENKWSVARWEVGLSEKGDGIKKYKLAVTK